MREILYRGKGDTRFNSGGWFYGVPIKDFEGDWQLCTDCTKTTVLPETIGQYTGLTDKNGKKIFEGDIIRYADNDEYEMYLESLECPEEYEGVDFSRMWTVDEVVYGDKIGYPAFDLNAHDFECNGLAALSESGGQWFYEVIGNIHDNPELLEAEK